MVSRLLLTIFALCLLGAPAHAQDADTSSDRKAADAEELRGWFQDLPEQRKKILLQRLAAFKRMSPERQRQARQAAAEGRPVLSEKQQKTLKQLKGMTYLQRVRLHTLKFELDLVRRGQRKEVKRAMSLTGAARARAIYRLIFRQRLGRFAKSLDAETLGRIRALPTREQFKTLAELYVAGKKARLSELAKSHPLYEDLRSRKIKGDRGAERDLRNILRDLATLDMLLQKLPPERRAAVMQQMKKLNTDDAARKLQNELRKWWKQERKKRRKGGGPHDRKPRKGERNGLKAKDRPDRKRD